MTFEHIADSIPELIVRSTRLVRIGQEQERKRWVPLLAEIFKAYGHAVADSRTLPPLPSSLMAAIESARQEVAKLDAKKAA